MHRGRLRPAARLFGLGLLGWLLLAGTAVVWGPLARVGGDRLFAPGPAVRRGAGRPRPDDDAAADPPLGRLGDRLRWPAPGRWPPSRWRCRRIATPGSVAGANEEPFRIGLGADRENIAAVLKEKTKLQARILWEDRRGPRRRLRLDGPAAAADRPRLRRRTRPRRRHRTHGRRPDRPDAGRPAARRLERRRPHDYCTHYNIGWVVCWSEKTARRFERFRRGQDATEAAVDLHDGASGWLVTLHRTPSFALHGAAHWQSADCNRIVLKDVRAGETIRSCSVCTTRRDCAYRRAASTSIAIRIRTRRLRSCGWGWTSRRRW